MIPVCDVFTRTSRPIHTYCVKTRCAAHLVSRCCTNCLFAEYLHVVVFSASHEYTDKLTIFVRSFEPGLQILGTRRWRRRVENREERRQLLRDAKARKGLYCHWWMDGFEPGTYLLSGKCHTLRARSDGWILTRIKRKTGKIVILR
jgi:hypothetical protein